MKYRNAFLKYHLFAKDGDGADDAGDTGGGGGGKPAEKSNQQNNELSYENLWQNETEESKPNQQQQGTPKTAAEQFDEHVAGLGFGSSADVMMEAFESRDPKKMAQAIAAMQKDVYKATMVNANKLMKENSQSLQQELQNNTSRTVENSKLIERLNNDLPMSKDPAFEPLAKAVLNQLLTQKQNGKQLSPEKALMETKRFFETMAEQVTGKKFSVQDSSRRRDQKHGDDDGEQEVDFVALFGGAKKQ